MTRSGLLLLVLTAVAVGACSPAEPQGLVVSAVAEDSVAAPGSPAVIRVTSTNTGDAEVSWGPGSSTCQLALLVHVDGTDLRALDNVRACTRDLRTHSLAPGESHTETLRWSGGVSAPDGVPPSDAVLEPGTYEVRGFAPPTEASPPVLITLEGDS
jgi:hypothetical protein